MEVEVLKQVLGFGLVFPGLIDFTDYYWSEQGDNNDGNGMVQKEAARASR